jgi:hypothetical protein
MIAYRKARVGTGLYNFTGSLIAWDKGITHSGKRRHCSSPEQLLSASRYAGMRDLDNDISRTRLDQRYLTQ